MDDGNACTASSVGTAKKKMNRQNQSDRNAAVCLRRLRYRQLMSESTPTYSPRERPVLTPTQLNKLARQLLEDAFAQVWVEGEISNLSLIHI